MLCRSILYISIVRCLFSSLESSAQNCPPNSNFSFGNLTNWEAYTGNNRGGNGSTAILQRYSPSVNAPDGTIGLQVVPEYLQAVPGIQVITTPGTDIFGGFSTIPTINGYSYNYSVMIGSTLVTQGGGGGGPAGGYVRGISYIINVPLGPSTEPYTMTYAYAMVLQNGTHNSEQQPYISATLTSRDGMIECASPRYYLPTMNNGTSGNSGSTTGATLDSATAIQNGFRLSSQPSPNPRQGNNGGGQFLQDVWTKDWTEVTFDLSPYRGQQVTLAFEADNCIPGGHFSYGYIALRSTCDGLSISGSPSACTNSEFTYSIPSLAQGSYTWSVPDDWSIISGANDHILKVRPGVNGGQITANGINGCANLVAKMDVITSPPTIAGVVTSDHTVCSGTNHSPLALSGNRGEVLKWIASTDGTSWIDVMNSTPAYAAENLTATTTYKAIVQNGPTCAVDTTNQVVITVDPRTVAGEISPSNMDICIGQNSNAFLTLSGNTGNIVNWQSSVDNINWTSFNPVLANSIYGISGVTGLTRFRTIVKSGVCPAETTPPAIVHVINVSYPQAALYPADTTICYGTSAELEAVITVGTSYRWTNVNALSNRGNGIVPSDPPIIGATASPLSTTQYIVQIENAGCPNLLTDTFNVGVYDKIIVNAGNDTAGVVNQALQLEGRVNLNTTGYQFNWSPFAGLDRTDVFNPVIRINSSTESAKYLLTVTSPEGCTASDDINVRIFKTAPDIFVPNAFSPGKSVNNVFRPVAAGIAHLEYFRIFNRWGQLLYSTSVVGQGWDGVHKGKLQSGESFVWMLKAITYEGQTIHKKGTMVLIR